MVSQAGQRQAREGFPCGLIQPAGSFRFSADALLLATFALRYCLPAREEPVILDLGCGCGVVGLACLLGCGTARGQGLDCEPLLVEAAGQNATLLGLEGRYRAYVADLETGTASTLVGRDPADVVLANMPYRRAGTGRLPRSALRRKALFAGETTMDAFMGAAARAVAADGSFALIFPWEGRGLFARSLRRHGFAVHTVLPVQTGAGQPSRCLVRAVRTPFEGRTRREGVLRLRTGSAGYTVQALAFCPWLATEKT